MQELTKENKGRVLLLARSRDPKSRQLVRNRLKVPKTPSRPPPHDLVQEAPQDPAPEAPQDPAPEAPQDPAPEAPQDLAQEAPLPSLVQELVGHDVTPTEEDEMKSFAAYPLTSHPCGLAVIINNEHFVGKKLSWRWGTKKDREALQTLFNHLGFETTTYDNLTASQMKAVLEGVAKRNHTHTQCLVVVILSHGEEEGLLHGTDNVLIGIKELADLFTGHKCSTLVGKPKLFFIQACRGKMFDTPATGYELTDGLKSTISPEGSKKKRELLPEQADFLFSFSTPEGYVARRNPEHGSWYVQTLVEVFMEFARKEHLLDMLTEVGRRMAKYQTKSGFKQIPALVSQLTKRLYFNPGQKKAVNSLHK